MGNRRTWTATFNGETYELSTCFAVVELADKACGNKIFELLADGLSLTLMKLMLFGGLQHIGATEVNGEPLTLDLVNNSSDLHEILLNFPRFAVAMAPDTPQPTKKSKNVPTEAPG